MRYDTDHKGKTRELVLKEAAAAIRAQGPDKISVAAIMARAGLTHGDFYAHFTSKDDLVAQAIGYMFEERYAAFLAHLDTPDPHLALSNFIESYLSMRHRNAIDRGCPIPVLSGDVPRMPPAARAIFVAAVDRLIDGISKLLERLEVEDHHSRATSLLSGMIGTLALSRLDADANKAEALLATSRGALLSDFL